MASSLVDCVGFYFWLCGIFGWQLFGRVDSITGRVEHYAALCPALICFRIICCILFYGKILFQCMGTDHHRDYCRVLFTICAHSFDECRTIRFVIQLPSPLEMLRLKVVFVFAHQMALEKLC